MIFNLTSLTMKAKATVQIQLDVIPEYTLASPEKCQNNDIFQKLTQRFLEDCKLHEISLSLFQLQHLTEAFLEKSIRTPQRSEQFEQESQTNCKPIELTFQIFEDLKDIL